MPEAGTEVFMQAGFARKYAIMEELDGGFSAGGTPEAFIRLDCWDGSIQVSIHVKGLKQGPYKHMLYLIFSKNGKLVPVLAGEVSASYGGMQSGLEIDAETLRNLNIRPESIRYAALTAESQSKKWIPLFSSFEKNHKWDESIRQVILMQPAEEPQREQPEDTQKTEQPYAVPGEPVQVQAQAMDGAVPGTQSTGSFLGDHPAVEDHAPPRSGRSKGTDKCDFVKLEGLLTNNFELYQPFKRPSRGYTWYRVSDLAKLSNIMYMAGINVPLFANPKILVGLFKFKHILAGLYHGDDGSRYYVIGVPAKDEKDNKPFENACRWVPVTESPVRDMGGYWLVYVSMKTGDIVV